MKYHWEIKLQRSNIRLLYKSNKESLLETLEKNSIHLEFQCRSGYCGSCRCHILKGEVFYYRMPLLAAINNKEILPCYCIPLSDLELDI